MNLAAYIRCSTDHQEDSPDVQRSIILEYCARNNHIITAEYVDDAISGGLPIAERPQAKLMLDNTKNHQFEGIIAKQVDRLGRNNGDTISFAAKCRKRNIQLLFCQETFEDSPAGRMHFSIMCTIAAYYREDIGQKIKDHNILCAKTGRWTSGNAPMGYTYDKINKTLIPDPERIPHVIRLFEIFIKNSGSRTLTAFRLNSEGIPAPHSPLWTHTQVTRTIQSAIYRGKQQYDNIEYPFKVEPIIDPNTVQQAYQLLINTKGRRQSTAKLNTPYPYNKILYCGQCGDRMYAEAAPLGTRHYRCSNRHYKGLCQANGVSETRLDSALLPILEGLLRKESKHIKQPRKPQDSPQKNNKAIEAQRERLLDAYVSGYLDKITFERKLAGIDKRISEVKPEVKQINIPVEILKQLAGNIGKHWHNFTDMEKRQLLTLLLPRVDVVSTARNEPLKLILNSPFLSEPLRVNWN